MHADGSSFKEKRRGNVFGILICGGIAGTVAKTVIAPFDRVKIHFQVQNPALAQYSGRFTGVFSAIRNIYLSSGVFGMYRGHSATILRIFPYAALNYFSYEMWKKILYNGQIPANVKWWKRILAGSLAGSVAVSITYPLDIIRARLAYDLSSRSYATNWSFSKGLTSYKSRVRQVLKSLSADGRRLHGNSFTGFYQGYIPTLLGILPYAGVSYFSFESLKILYQKHVHSSVEHYDVPIPAIFKLPMGMIAGALAQTVAYPLDVIRRRMQVLYIAPHLSGSSNLNNASITNVIRTIIRQHGFRGFFVGLSVNYLKVAPASGISFAIYETLKDKVFFIKDT